MLDHGHTVPALYCPIPPSVSPHATDAEQKLKEWLARYNLAADPPSQARLKKLCVTDFVSRAYPDSTPEDLAIVLAWTAWAFLADDVADEGNHTGTATLEALGARYRSYVGVLRNGKLEDNDDLAPLCDLRSRIIKRSSLTCLNRFATAVEDWFRALHWEVSNRVKGEAPGVQEYLDQRRITVGMYTEFALFDLTHQTEATAHLWEDPIVQRMMESASNIIAWSNDIFSFPKEAAAKDSHNLILLLQERVGHSEARSVRIAQRMHDREMERFLTLERQLLRSEEPSLQSFRFVDMMKCWIRSNVDWAQITGRYNIASGSLSPTAQAPTA